MVLNILKKATLCCTVLKYGLGLHKVEYLGYILSCDGIAPYPEKGSAILAHKEPTNVKDLRRFLGMVQYYHGICHKRGHRIALLTDPLGQTV